MLLYKKSSYILSKKEKSMYTTGKQVYICITQVVER